MPSYSSPLNSFSFYIGSIKEKCVSLQCDRTHRAHYLFSIYGRARMNIPMPYPCYMAACMRCIRVQLCFNYLSSDSIHPSSYTMLCIQIHDTILVCKSVSYYLYVDMLPLICVGTRMSEKYASVKDLSVLRLLPPDFAKAITA